MTGQDNLTPWEPGQSGNPKGHPKGQKNLAYWIQKMLTDESFTFKIRKEPKGATEEFTGAPIKAIIAVAIHRSMLGDKDAREWLAKHGYGHKIVVAGEDPVEAALRKLGLLGEEDAGQDSGTSDSPS